MKFLFNPAFRNALVNANCCTQNKFGGKFLSSAVIFIALFLFSGNAFGQLAGVKYSTQLNFVRGHDNDCADGGTEEYSSHVWTRDNVDATEGTTGCLQVNCIFASCNYGTAGAAIVTNRKNISTSILIRFDGWEDDPDTDAAGRCTFDSDDDCRLNQNSQSVAFRTAVSPSNGTFTISSTFGDNDRHEYSIRYTWMYDATATGNTALTFACGSAQTTTALSGDIRSWSFAAIAGQTYRFSFSGSNTIRVYGTDGFTAQTVTGGSGVFNFTPSSSGTYYAELAATSRGSLTSNVTLSYQLVCPSDNNACTTDGCSSGTCTYTAVVCNDNSVCTTDACNAPTIGCVFTAISCNDNISCTVDACNAITGCSNTNTNSLCNDNNVCTNDACDPANGNLTTGCVYTNNTASCTDGSACTDPDVCGGGSCQPGAALNCDDGLICTADGCNPGSGCTHTYLPPSCAISGQDSICISETTTFTASGGTSYLWSTTETTDAITVGAPGIYSVTVTNANGCTSTCSITLVIATPFCSISGDNKICLNTFTSFTASGAGVGGSYAWSGPDLDLSLNTANTGNINEAGLYSVTVTNYLGCTSECSYTLTVDTLPVCSITGADTTCDNAPTAWTAHNGSSYAWSGPNGFNPSTAIVNVIDSGTYTVTVTDGNGCTSSCTKHLALKTSPTVAISGDQIICPGESTEFVATIVGGTSFSWSGPGGFSSTNDTIGPLTQPGYYAITITDAVSGCSRRDSLLLFVTSSPVGNISGGTNEICAGVIANSWTATPGGLTYAWTFPNNSTASTQSITAILNGVYTVTMTNAAGCKDTASRTLTVKPLPVCSITGIDSICAGQTTGFRAHGGTSYVWNRTGGGGTFVPSTTSDTLTWSNATGAMAGVYNVTATLNGCTSTCSRRLAVNTANCNDGNPCTTDGCNGYTGCSNTAIPSCDTCAYTTQTVTLYSENFTGYAVNTITGSGSPAKFTATNPANDDYFSVQSFTGELMFAGKDINTFFSNDEGVWTSQIINISGYANVSVSMTVHEDGDQNADDYIRVTYDTDLLPETNFTTNGNLVNDFNTTLIASQTGITGSTLVIRVRINNDDDDEIHRFDNVLVTGIDTTFACDDGNACTADACNGIGVCVYTPIVCNDNNPCTDDACDTGIGCVYTNNTNLCNDNTVCTANDVCGGGICAGTPIVCDDNTLCTTNSCHAVNGCVFTTINCDDQNPCTTDGCNALTGCTNNAIPGCDTCTYVTQLATAYSETFTTTPSSQYTLSGGPFTGSFQVTGGVLQGTDMDNEGVLTTSVINISGLSNVSITAVLSEEGDSESDDYVRAFYKLNGSATEIQLTNGNQIDDFTSATATATGLSGTSLVLVFRLRNSSNAEFHRVDNIVVSGTDTIFNCNDGNACTSDACNGIGVCIYTPIVCNDNNVCTTDDCNPASGCFTIPVICNDNNACTSDACNAPSIGCQYTPIVCNDNNPCTDDACDTGTGCFATNDNTNTCSDNSACTVGDACIDGACVPGIAPDCNDNNLCTDDSCNPLSGCVNANNTLSCDDNDACTEPDICGGGSCQSGAAVNCDDGNECTTEICDVVNGCIYTDLSNGTACLTDGDACTDDICADGTCTHPATNCDDSEVCTLDGCDTGTGCTYAINYFTGTVNLTLCQGDCYTSPLGNSYCNQGIYNDTLFGGNINGCDSIVIINLTVITSCADGNSCTDDICSAGVCSNPNNNAATCTDGINCTEDVCTDGTCVSTPKECNDTNFCTDDACDENTGNCAYTAHNCSPVITTPAADLTVECGANNTAELNAWLAENGGALANAECAPVNWTNNFSALSDDCGFTGSAEVTFTAEDVCGNTASSTATFTIEDTTPPSLDLPATSPTVECDGAGNVSDLQNWLDDNGGVAASDLCGGVTLSYDTTHTLACGATSVVNAIFTATDDCGNTATSTGIFTVEDTNDPSIFASAINVIIECAGAGNLDTLNAWLALNGGAEASDDCGSVSWSNSFTSLSNGCGATGTATVIFTVADDCGNTSTSSATFTIEDTTPPTIDTPASDDSAECDGTTGALDAWLADNGGATASDLCGGVAWSNDFTGLTGCGNTGSATVTFTATDACGLTATTSATFSLTDNTAPTLDVAASDATNECGPNNDSELNAWLADNGGADASDACGNVTWSADTTGTDGCGATFSVAAIFTATDECGNTTTTSASFTIEDNTDPSLDTPAADYTAECDGLGNLSEFSIWLGSNGDASASDACGNVTWSNDFSSLSDECGATGSVTVIFTATDECGNTTTTSASFTIEDNTAPALTPAVDYTAECDGAGNSAELTSWLANNGGASANDNCGDVTWSNDFSALSDDCGATGNITVTFTATDDCSNTATTTATFTIEDTTPPSIDTEAASASVECDGFGNTDTLNNWLAANGGATASDLCGSVTWSNDFTALSGGCGATGTATVIFTVADDCGNTSTSSATFTIEDTTPPTIDTPASDDSAECDGTTGALDAWLADNGGATASDLCGGVAWSNDFTGLTGCGNTGSATVTFTATDACGLTATTSATFSLTDNTAPTLDVAASDATNECGPNNDSELNAWLADNGGADASDACGNVTWTNDFTELSDECGNTGSATVIFTATDACGNTTTTSATFTIEDNLAPSISEPAKNDTVECDGLGNLSEFSIWLGSNGDASASDACGSVTWTNDYTAFTDGCGATGKTTVTFTATDECGHTATTSATFTIEDNTAPSVTTPAEDITIECGLNDNFLDQWLNNNGSAEASDNCSDVVWSHDFTLPLTGCSGTGSVVVTFTATDDCGNTATTSATYKREDTKSPNVTPATDLTVECDGAGNTADLNTWLAENGSLKLVGDLCDVGFFVEDDFTALSDDCGLTGSAVVTFTFADACGNTTTTSATFKIEDTTPPTIDTEASDAIVECDGAGNTDTLNNWLANNGGATASDICGDVTWSHDFTDLSDGCGETGTATVIFTATDDCGNTATTSATFTIEDTEDPEFVTFATPLTVECGVGNAEDLDGWLANNGGVTTDDLCGSVTVSYELVTLIPGCGGSYGSTYTFVATDACGNTSGITLGSFNVEDNTDPVISCPGSTTIESTESTDPTNTGSATCTDCDPNATPTYSDVTAPGLCPNQYMIERTWTCADACGNTSTCIQTISVSDTEAPEITCPADVTLDCTASTDTSNTGAASCGETLAYSDNTIPGSCPQEFVIERTWTCTDECGNPTSCLQTITVEDNDDPTAVCKDINVQLDGTGNASITADLVDDGSSDVCGIVSISLDKTDFTCADVVGVSVTLTVEDACGNTSSCTATATVEANCDDSDACTSDECNVSLGCTHTPVDCDDNNPCTDDDCDLINGCSYTNNFASCDDGSACTDGDICSGGSCSGDPISCNDNNPCTNDECYLVGGCVYTNNNSTCDDGDACTADKCNNGTCSSLAIECTDNNPCTDNSCNPSSGCVTSNNSSSCDDGNACTTSDVCSGGSCQGGAALSCTDNNPCTDNSCNPASGCVTTNNTASCSDGNACTTGDVCSGGSCQGGAALSCTDNNPCTDNSCDPASGCVTTNNSAPCSDGNACTNDVCSGGACVGTPIPDCGNLCLNVTCNDNNICTSDACNPTNGNCVFTNNSTSCSDGNACTTGDVCSGGSCQAGTPLTCTDNNPCTDNSCNPASGCVTTNNTASCSDGNACTTGDACSGGSCQPGTAVNCNDNNSCTIDACNPGSGCVFSPNPNCQPCTLEVVSLTLINSSTDVDIRTLNASDTIKRSCTPNINIRANLCVSPVGSVKFKLNNNSNYKTENIAPYAIAGDSPPGNYNNWNVAPGLYTITATPYSGANGTGTAGTPKTITVLIQGPNVPCAPQCTNNAQCSDNNLCTNDACVNGICVSVPKNCNDNSACTTDACNPSNGNCLNTPIVCNDNNPCTLNSCNSSSGCVFTPIQNCCTSNAQCNDNNPCTNDVCAQNNVCSNSPNQNCCSTNAQCNDNNSCTNDVCTNGVCSNTLILRVVTSFTLVNSATDLDIGTLNNGAIIDLAIYPDVSVRANLCTNTGTESIRFKLNSNSNFQTENAVPYALMGDNPPGNYHKWNVTPGTYTITATPYSGNYATGIVGTPKTITITVINTGSSKMSMEDIAEQPNEEEVTLAAYPNPFSETVNIEFSLSSDARVRVEIVNLEGKVIGEIFEGNVRGGETQLHKFNAGTLANGMYFYRLITEDGKIHNRKLILNR